MSNGTGDDGERTKFLLFGGASSEKDWAEVSEIDLVVAEFDGAGFYDAAVTLDVYEKLAAATGKPVDLFFSMIDEGFTIAGWYDPKVRRWEFRNAFCGKGFFDGLKAATFRELVSRSAAGRSDLAAASHEPSRFLVEVPDRFAVASWPRNAEVAEIARCILGTLKYEPHSADTAMLRRALEDVIERGRKEGAA